MPADDAAVVVRLQANLKDYEAALKSAVRSTERAAQAAEKAVAGIGKTTSGRGMTALNDNFAKSAAQIQNDARVLQFQLNDIFSGIASGQGIRALQVQLGQIAQQMSGGSLTAGARTLGTAMLGMINPINLAVVAFGFAATAAANYFSNTEKDAEEARKELDKQASAIRKLADEYGVLFPELERIAKLREAEADAAGKAVAKEEALKGAYEDTQKTIDNVSEKIEELTGLLQLLGASPETINAITSAFGVLDTATTDYKASSAEAKVVIAALDTIIRTQTGAVVELAKAIREQLVGALGELDRAYKSTGETLKNAAPFQFPGAGGPLDLAPLQRARQDALDKTLNKLDGTLDNFVERVIQAESGGRAAAKNPLSSATGAGQFIESTWLSVFKSHFATEAAGMSDAAILALRTDIETNRRMIRAYATDNAKLLIDAGQDVNEAALQLAHFLGAGGAIKVLSAPRGTPVSQILPQNVIAANRSILGGGATREDVLAYAGRRAGAAATPQLTVSEKALANLKEWNVDTQHRIELEKQVADINAQVWVTEAQRSAQVEALRIAEEQLYALRKAGVTVDAEMEAGIRRQAEALAQVTVKSQDAAAAQRSATVAAQQNADSMRQLAQTVAGLAVQGITGFVQDLRNGVDAAEALYNAVSRIADQLLQMALQRMFTSILGGFSGGGFVGGPGGLYASGGYTGPGPTNQPAGIVHRGEYVVNAAATARHRNLLESINKGLPGYASGGFVLPRINNMMRNQMQPTQSASPSVNTRTTVVNTFDAGSFLSEALSRPDGVNVILNAVRAQPGAFRTALGS